MWNLRRPTPDETNRIFVPVMLGGGAIIGSAISFLLAGAILAGLVRLQRGVITISRRPEILAIGAVFALYWLVTTITAAVNYEGPRSMIKAVEALPFLGFLLIHAQLSHSRRHDIVRVTEYGVIIGALGALAFGLVQLMILGQPRAVGLAGNPGVFAPVTAFLYGMAIVSAVRNDGGMRLIAAIAAAAAATAMLLSGMRTLWPALVLLPLALLFVLKFRPDRRVWFSGVALVAVLALGVGLLTRDMVMMRLDDLAAQFRSTFEENDLANSLGLRVDLWKVGLQLAMEHPWLGHGPGRIPALLEEITATREVQYSFTHLHNFVLNAWVRSGVPGVVAIVLLLAVPPWLAARARRDGNGDFGLAMMVIVVVTYATSGTLNIMLDHDILDALFIFALATASFLVFDSADREHAAEN